MFFFHAWWSRGCTSHSECFYKSEPSPLIHIVTISTVFYLTCSNLEVEEMDTDWPSPAPNPSLTMQLWVLIGSPRRVCCISATMSLNRPVTAPLTAPQKLDRNHATGPKTNKNHKTAFITGTGGKVYHASRRTSWMRKAVWYSAAAAEVPEWKPWYYKLLFLWMPASQHTLHSV